MCCASSRETKSTSSSTGTACGCTACASTSLCVGAVYYVTRRLAGANEADDIVRRMRAVVDLDLPSADRIMAAARIKAQHALAYADAFAVATTLAYDAVLYTGDPEILETTAGWPVRDLRSSG